MALGNVVGSNIFNVLFILGVSALIVPLKVSRQLIRIDVPLMVGASIAVLVLAMDGRIGSVDGLLLTAGLVTYTVWTIAESRREQSGLRAANNAANDAQRNHTTLGGVVWNVLLLTAGLALLVLGSRWFVSGAVELAHKWGISELVIGLTIVAAGTSLPELFTSVVAAIHGERDIAVGNVVGSNIFNILAVLGVSGLVGSEGVAVSDAAPEA